jgi:AsmA protein
MKSISKEMVKGEISFQEADLSFFKHFPNLTFTLYNYSFKGSAPFENDTLISGEEVSFGINIASVFAETIEINKIFFHKSFFNIITDKEGRTNYDIYEREKEIEIVNEVSTETHLSIEGITVTDCRIKYKDDSFPMLLVINNLDYLGKGKLDNNLFRLESGIYAEGVDFMYDGVIYLKNKQIKSMMVTEVITEPFKINFPKNELLINNLPINFTGTTKFLKNGYDVDFTVIAGVTEFGNFFSILPPEYDNWFANTHFDGTSKLTMGMKGLYLDSTDVAPNISIQLSINKGNIRHKLAPKPIENLQVNASLSVNNFNFDSLEMKIDTLSFDLSGESTTIYFKSKGLDNPYLKANIDSKIDLGLLVQAIGLDSLKLAGNLELNANLEGKFDTINALMPVLKSRIKLKNGMIETAMYPQPIEQIEINTRIDCISGKMSDLEIEMQPVSFNFEQQPFSVKTNLRNFDDLQYDITAKGTLNLKNLYQVFAVEDYSVTGLFLADLDLHGRQSDAEKGFYQKLNNNGTLGLSNVELRSTDYPFPFIIPQATMRIENDKAWLKNSQLNYRENYFYLDGYMQDFIGYTLLNNELTGILHITSPKLNIEDFMPDSDTESVDTTVTSGVVQLPGDLNLTLTADVKIVNYMQTPIENFSGEVQLKKSKLSIQNTRFDIAGANIHLNASYLPLNESRAVFDFSMKADSFDIKRAYNEIPIFKEMVTAAADAEGLISMEYALKGKLNEKMEAIYPSINGNGYIKLENVKMKGYKLFSEVGKAVGRDSINDPNLKAVIIKSSIANNIITIEKTKMKVFGFRPTFSGQTSLDGKFNLFIRLGLPPLGIVGIPLSVTGTSENPIVKVRKDRESDKLEETEEENFKE